ncbi:MAG TPA: hypothetical protein VKA27_14660 [Sunxiuqinia sp.]|nr:hypothetical protein [Sunxiuqinia sp.]
MNDLLNKLKKEDQFLLRLYKGIQILYWILIPVYTMFFVFAPDKELTLIERFGGGCAVIAFIIFVIIFRKRIKEQKSVDYSLPSVQMLEHAAERYKIWKPEIKWALLAVLITDVGMVLLSYDEMKGLSPIMRILQIQYIFIPMIIVAILVGIFWWYKKHKPLRDHALELLEELKS